MKKRDKYLTRALEALSYKVENEDLQTENDVKRWISENKTCIEDCKNAIEKATEIIKEAENANGILADILRQIEIEKYKELNPNRTVMMLK